MARGEAMAPKTCAALPGCRRPQNGARRRSCGASQRTPTVSDSGKSVKPWKYTLLSVSINYPRLLIEPKSHINYIYIYIYINISIHQYINISIYQYVNGYQLPSEVYTHMICSYIMIYYDILIY